MLFVRVCVCVRDSSTNQKNISPTSSLWLFCNQNNTHAWFIHTTLVANTSLMYTLDLLTTKSIFLWIFFSSDFSDCMVSFILMSHVCGLSLSLCVRACVRAHALCTKVCWVVCYPTGSFPTHNNLTKSMGMCYIFLQTPILHGITRKH